MDFFEAQARAKRRTATLVLLFALALLGTIAASYVAAWFVVGGATASHASSRHSGWTVRTASVDPSERPLFDPSLFGGVTAVILVVVGGASLFKWLSLSRGGPAVAELVGGHAVAPQTTNLHEKRLLNVVEEMAIASGVPVPAVYVLDDEPSINAFAAGLTPHDAVVAVTRGTLEKLSRDELQGVVAHEFSHILNGDMRINIRFTAIVFGILVLGLIGRGILRGLARGRIRSGGGKGKGGGIALVLAIGLALLIIGYVGYFFGRIIQAAVSRQREFLADASAVQFTRNPEGITGALRKIGGYALGGHLQSDKAAEIGHFFFAQGFSSFLGSIWATHPPLAERIRAIDPRWDGQMFEPPEAVDIEHETFATAGFSGPRLAPDEALQKIHEVPPILPPVPPPMAPVAFRPSAVMADVGALTEEHLRRASALVAGIPERLRAASRAPESACILVYGILLAGGDRTDREKQLAVVARCAGPEAVEALAPLRPALSVLDPSARLPLIQLCETALRALEPATLERFLTTLDELVHADERVTAYEYSLQRMLAHHLRLGRPRQIARATTQDSAIVLAVLARVGQRESRTIESAFRAGAEQLGSGGSLAMPSADASDLASLDEALDRLALLPLEGKRRLLVAAAHTIGADGTVTPEEGDLFRAIAAAIDCPIPPLRG